MNWAWWQDALANPKEIGKRLPVSVDVPEQGFYRTRYKNKPWEPVAIWQDESGKWIALRNGKPVDALNVWNWCCRHPITSEAYERALNGDGWADDDPNVAAALSMAGHNVEGKDERELLEDEINSAKQGAEAYAKITDDDQAGKAQSLRARMNELSGKADKQREALKRPHLEAGKAVDAEWQPLVKDAKAVADMLRKAIESYETVKLAVRRQQEERARREDAAGGSESVPAPIETKLKGNYGRAASIGAKRLVTGINLPTVANYYLSIADQRLRDALMIMAQKDIDLGREIPGVTTEERATIS